MSDKAIDPEFEQLAKRIDEIEVSPSRLHVIASDEYLPNHNPELCKHPVIYLNQLALANRGSCLFLRNGSGPILHTKPLSAKTDSSGGHQRHINPFGCHCSYVCTNTSNPLNCEFASVIHERTCSNLHNQTFDVHIA